MGDLIDCTGLHRTTASADEEARDGAEDLGAKRSPLDDPLSKTFPERDDTLLTSLPEYP